MEITVIQAILIGISCWLGSVENPQPLGVAFSDALSKPIVGGTIVGMILGDIPTGVTIGAAIQAMYLGQVLIGGVATAVIGSCLAVMYYMFMGNQSGNQSSQSEDEEDELL